MYRSMLEFLVPNITSYFTFLSLQTLLQYDSTNTTIVPASTILSSRHYSSLTTLLPGANLTLKYRGTKDGWSSITFHTMCHDVAPNFAVFRTTLNVIFTAYTPVAFTLSPWTFQRPTVDCYRPAPAGSAWLNNLENRTGAINTTRFFNTKNPESTIFDMNRYGPNYGFGWDIFTDDPININGTADEWTYVGSEGIAGTRRFNLTELEFYHVTYDNQLP